MTILPISAFIDNYIWAILDQDLGVFDCIDPGDAAPVLDFAKKNELKLRTILLTHHHDDHIGGVNELLQVYPNCIIYGPKDLRIPQAQIIVAPGQHIQVGLYTFDILFNPGHTSSHISYFEPQEHWLFCGDTLFSAGCGRVFDGTLEQLHQSLELFKTLPLSTKIYCAHEYTQQNLRFAQIVEPNNASIKEELSHQKGCTLPSTLERELSFNPFLRTSEPTVIDYAMRHGATSKNSLDVFRVLREQKNVFP